MGSQKNVHPEQPDSMGIEELPKALEQTPRSTILVGSFCINIEKKLTATEIPARQALQTLEDAVKRGIFSNMKTDETC